MKPKRVGGRPARFRFSNETKELALKRIHEAVEQGEQWALQIVAKRIEPELKPMAKDGSAEHQLMKVQIKKASELEEQFKQIKEALGI
ncbi:hypothetical protein BCS96_06555 [Vibrio breoganii]|nr:hypothetical protein [Vibrio breoganii]PMG35309.1 hypothetical protein BCU93_17670 [Vibrio breoganii]PMG90794.1 hypothetical protein BCU81_05390 [Vibrio breoganii]PMH15847.1 hypothetical protein BCU74_14000 [Vibrio breoganii]PML80797.1 hypothetical protein BCT68_14720 [Vibrio breoganii]PML92390.1 hypothetical protein BCT64_16385 [Vibrio breoganii]